MSAVIGVIVTGILLVYAKVFVGLFMDSSSNQAAIATGIEYLRVVGLFYALMGIMNTCTGVLREQETSSGFDGNADQLKLPCDPCLQHVRDARCKGYLVVDPDWLGHRLCNRFCTLLKRKMAEKQPDRVSEKQNII